MLEVYEEVKLWARKHGKCICGKKIVRSTTFMQTLSPFNKKDGRLKTEDEIIDELKKDREEWLAEPVHCTRPTYWEWTPEQREEYNAKGEVLVAARCGASVLVKDKSKKK